MSEESFFKDGKFFPALLAQKIQDETDRMCTPMTETGGDIIYQYHTKLGIYRPDGITTIQALAKEELGEKATPNKVSQVVELCKIDTYIRREDFEEDPNIVVMKNGVYDLTTDEFKRFSPSYNSKSQIPVKYSPKAECPNITKFLGEVVDKQDIPKLIELPGYCLLKSMPIARLVILAGVGENGKSVYLRLLGAFLGNENISSISLQKLAQDGFRTAELYGKLANLCGDIPGTLIKDVGVIKTLTGQDPITAERKYRDPFQYTNFAKPVFSANKVPPTIEDTRALHRRMVIIKFPNIFSREDPKTDINLLEKLITPEELSGFFNFAIAGLKRFLAQKGFSNEKPVEERRIEYMRESNPVQYFATGFVDKKRDSWITKGQVYDAYVSLCVKLDKIPVANTWFSREVRRFLPYTYEGQQTIGGVKTKVWRGIKVKNELLDTVDTEDTVYPLLLDDPALVYNNKENDVSVVSTVSDSPQKGFQGELEPPVDLSKPRLQNMMDEFLRFLGEIEKATGGEPVDFIKFTEELVSEGWIKEDVKRISEALKNHDKMIFEARPGFIKRCSP